MTRVAARRTIPDEGLLLCAHCGYVITGLPAGARCPECGADPADSDPARRTPAAWEDPEDRRTAPARFLATTCHVLVRPAAFYRGLLTRGDPARPRAFAFAHWSLCAVLLGAAISAHMRWFWESSAQGAMTHYVPLAAVLAACVFLAFQLTTSLAARLTHWEASYRGLRMPMPVVLRAMYYHAAHYLPVAAIALITVVGYQYLLTRGVVSGATAVTYLYLLCAEVVAAAFYLFKTYWTAMRNVMYANR